MNDLPEPDDATFRLATGEELVMPGSHDSSTVDARGNGRTSRAGVAAPARGAAPRPSARDRRTAGRLRARKVRRLVRHVEPWSVLKVSLIFSFCLWVILLIAGVILWSFAVGAGTVDNVENFVRELFALETFEFNADEIFRAGAIGGLVIVVAGSGFMVLMAVLFNLISDLTGGVRFTVVEEETARPRPKRTRPRHGAAVAMAGTEGRQMPSAPPPLLAEVDIGELGNPDVRSGGPGIPVLPTAETVRAQERAD